MMTLRPFNINDAETILSWCKDKYAQQNLGANRITLGVFYHNLSALECYKSVGFYITRMDTYTIDGEEWKGFEMELNIFTQEPIAHTLAYDQTVADVLAWYAFEGIRRVLHHLCIFGRMNLTNYLLQSVIGCAIFCGYGLACYHLLGTTYAVMVGCGMVICQYLFARYWFSSHPRRPLEGLWRKLTWM